jgi:hypothetical protein
MNTKIIMTASAVILGATGVILVFSPDTALLSLGIQSSPASLLLVQVIGGLYFGFFMLNWMIKGGLIGGIYNRPIVIANFAHFFIVGLSVVKTVTSNRDLPWILWAVGAVYVVFGIVFMMLMFRHPIRSTTDN